MHEKNMCDPYSDLSILLYGVIPLPDATSCDKYHYPIFGPLFPPTGYQPAVMISGNQVFCTERGYHARHETLII